MQRYFCNNCNDNEYLLSNDDSYHIKKVMRMSIGDKIEIVCNKVVYLCEIISFDPVRARIVNKLDEDNEEIKKITLVQSFINENKMDYVLQKGTEVGINEFYVYKAHNSVVKENDKSYKKIARWQTIVKEASEQSKRNIIPKVVDIIDINRLCKMEADLKILLTVNEKTRNLKKVIYDNKNCGTIIIVVGPEGGFIASEENKLMENGYISTSLGKRVLRSETAGVVASSMLNYEWMV